MKPKVLFKLISPAAVVLASALTGYSGPVVKHGSAPKDVCYEVRAEAGVKKSSRLEVASQGGSGQIGRQLLTAAISAGPQRAFSAQGESGQIG